MKKQILKKLYSFIFAAMMFSASANAQIVYTDINPDTSVGSSYQMDLNNDGSSDYVLTKNYTINGSCGFAGANYTGSSYIASNNINFYFGIATGNASALASGILINNNYTWATTTHLLLYCHKYCTTFTINGNFISADMYLPVKYIIGGNNYFGWIKINIPHGKFYKLTIKSYAYNSIPNQPILAGETSCTNPTVNLTQNGSLSFCAGDSVTFTANGTGYQYQWKKNNVNIAGAKSQTYVAKTAGVYKCKVTNSCGSKTSGTRTVTVPCRMTNEVFTEQLENPYELKIAPNPFSNSTTISFSLEQSQNVSLKLFDLNGRLIKTLADNVFEGGENEIVWNAAEANTGIYFLQFQSAETLQTEKLIVTK